MIYHDISVEINSNLPIWPGDPKACIERIQKLEDGANANVSKVDMGLHTGTHVDAPYHFLENGAKLSEIPLERFFGRATVINIPEEVGIITADVLGRLERSLFTERILFKTRNSGFWKETSETFHADFVGIDLSGAQFIVEKDVRLVGIDYLSIAPFRKSKPTHETLLGAGIVIIEGLNLSDVDQGVYQLYCLPIKLGDAEGSPARVILIDSD
jgi:arylformamidase